MSAQASHCSHYQPPLQDIRFVQQHWLGAEADWRRMPAHEALDQETADMVVEAAGRFCADVLAPLNGPADLQGCRLEALYLPEDGPRRRAAVSGILDALATFTPLVQVQDTTQPPNPKQPPQPRDPAQSPLFY